jgi:type I restriction enzyme M protein
VFARGGRTAEVMFLHAENDGYKLDANHDQPIEADDLPALVAAFGSRAERLAAWRARDAAKPWTEKWWFAGADQIEAEGWNLSASRYRPQSREAAEHRDPRALLAELREETAAILADLDALAGELEERVG